MFRNNIVDILFTTRLDEKERFINSPNPKIPWKKKHVYLQYQIYMEIKD